MKKIHIVAIAVLLSAFASAQTRKGDTLFVKWEYFKAAAAYETEAASNPSQDLYYKLGQCYQKMNRFKEALSAYDKVNATGHYSNARFYLNYGLMLKTGERYADAKDAFTMYSSMVPSDSRGNFYMNSCDVAMEDNKSDLPITITGASSLNSNAADMCPVLYKDGIMFISSRKTEGHDSKTYGWDGQDYLDIYYAKIGNSDTSFTKIEPIQNNLINTKYHNGPVCFSNDFTTIYFDRVSKELRGKEKKTLNIETIKIYSAVNKNGEWVDLKPFKYNNDTFSVATPYLTKDGSRLYFSSDMPGGYGGDDIYYCLKQGDGWGKPINMGPSINTFGNEKYPTMDDSGNFYFSSDGYKGFGGMDICVSHYNNGDYGQASVMKEPFNSPGNDYGIIFTKTGKAGYFTSNRGGGKGGADIYSFDMDKDNLPCPVIVSDYIIGFICPQQKPPIVVVDSILPTPEKTIIVSVGKAEMLIHFDFDKYNIRPDAAKILDSMAADMHNNPQETLDVNGYCDSRGTDLYNQGLSNLRSASTVNYLVSKGIAKKRMLPKGYGKTNILNRCTDGVVCSPAEQQENRRVEMLFIPLKNKIALSEE